MNVIDRDCLVGKCTSVQHGGQLAAAATRRTGESQLAAYMRWLCGTCGRVTDSSGRTALHLAASCGHRDVARWLVRRADAGINIRDVESGYTALHRSIFYGQIHVAADLIKMGASLTARDHDGLTPIDHAMKDRPAILEFNGHSLCEVYVWGTNNNYSLGTGNQQSRSQPELLDLFRKQGISIKQVAMHKFHSVFVSHDGRVFSCGHGHGGRLGLNTEGAALTPCVVRLPSNGSHSPDGSSLACTMASVGRDHTVLLMENGTVWSCGLNTYHQLGLSPPPPKVLVPRQLSLRSIHAAGESVIGICATRFHTVIWGQKAVLTCGLNAGQLGHMKGPNPTTVLPRLVSALTHKPGQVVQVAASDGATVVAVERSVQAGGTCTAPGADIYVLHEFKCHKIATRHVGVVQLAVVGGHLDTTVIEEEQQGNAGSREEEQLRVLMLDNRGHLYFWQENVTKEFARCFFSLNRSLMVTGVSAQTRGQLLLVTHDGEAFEGEIKVQKSGAEVAVRVKRLPHIHRAVAVTSDPKGRNFAIVQAHPIASLLEIPQMESSDLKQQMSNLLEEASEEDLIHDVVFQVGVTRFPAHQYIIASRCEVLAKRIAEVSINDGVPTVHLKGLKPEVFRQILQFIYTNTCSILQPGESPIKVIIPDDKDNKHSGSDENLSDNIFGTKDPNSISAFEVYNKQKHSNNNKTNNNKQKSSNNVNPIRMVQEAARKFGLHLLQLELEKIRFEDNCIIKKQGFWPNQLKTTFLNRQDHPHLYNVKIRSEEGKELQAHKCVLVARLEYFHSMLSGRWVETSGKKECVLSLPLPFKVLQVLIDFLYTDSSPEVEEWEDLEFVSNVLVIADQFFVLRLKDAAQVALKNMLTLRNVGQVLQLSGTYNAKQLKYCCLQYITLNMSAVLEARILESVEKDLLQDLTTYYCEFIPAMSRRIITPYSTAPSEELIQTVNDAHPILPWDVEDDSYITDDDFALLKKGLKSAKKKSRTRKSSTGESGGNNKVAVTRARNESVGSNNSWGDEIPEDHRDIDIDELTEKPIDQSEDDITLMLSESPPTPAKGESPWVKIVNSYDKQQRIVQARLRTVTAARDIPIKPTPESFTKLVPLSRQQEGRSIVESPPISVPLTSTEFPELQKSSPPSHHDHSKMQNHKHCENKKLTKLSQKQRKKLAAEHQVGSPEQTVSETMQPVWGNMTKHDPVASQSFSLLDIMKQEMQQTKGPHSPPLHITRGAPSPPSQLSTSPGPGPNPWVKRAEIAEKSRQERLANNSAVNFQDIVADEKKQRENWSRMRAKPLQLTQLEDRAIEDLLVFYNAAGSTDEVITVKRVITGTVAPPTWITSRH